MHMIFIILFFKFLRAQKICTGYIKNIEYKDLQINLFKYDSLNQQVKVIPPDNLFIIPIYEDGLYTIKPDLPSQYLFDHASYNIKIDQNKDIDECQGTNFIFNFKGFSLSSKVFTYPKFLGPRGVHVSVLDKNNKLICENLTNELGGAQFDRAFLPGIYQIVAKHDHWSFLNDKTSLTLEHNGNIKMDKGDIIIAGFNLETKIQLNFKLANGAFGESKIYLFKLSSTFSKGDCDHVKCQGELLSSSIILDGYTFCKGCHQKSSKISQEFKIMNINPGKYRIVSKFEYDKTDFDIVPKYLDVEITNDDQSLLKFPFVIKGFSSYGRIYTSAKKTTGLKGVHIHLNEGQYPTISDSNGEFFINNIEDGRYNVTLTKEHYYFSSSQLITINPGSLIDNLYPEKYDVCGTFEIELENDERSLNFSDVEVKFIKKDREAKPNTYFSVQPNLNGTFCLPLQPGIYETNAVNKVINTLDVLWFKPNTKILEITDNPVLNLKFNRAYVSLSGDIHCLNQNCKEMLRVNGFKDNTFDQIHLKVSKIPASTFETSLTNKVNDRVPVFQFVYDSNQVTDNLNTSFSHGIKNNFIRYTIDRILPGYDYKVCLATTLEAGVHRMKNINLFDKYCWEPAELCQIIKSSQTSVETNQAGPIFIPKFVQKGKKFEIKIQPPSYITLAIQTSSLPLSVPAVSTLTTKLNHCTDVFGDISNYKIDEINYCKLVYLDQNRFCIPSDTIWKFQIVSCIYYGFDILTIKSIKSIDSMGISLPNKLDANNKENQDKNWTQNYFILDTKVYGQSPDLVTVSFLIQMYKLRIIVISSPSSKLKSHNLNFEDVRVCLTHTANGKRVDIKCSNIQKASDESIAFVSDKNYALVTFNVDVQKYSNLTVIIKSSIHLFAEYEKQFNILDIFDKQDCEKADIEFSIIPSINYHGYITPAKSGVQIWLIRPDEPDKVLKTLTTSANGYYHFGPVISGNYEIFPKLDGFSFHAKNAIDEDKSDHLDSVIRQDFEIVKISQLIIHVEVKNHLAENGANYLPLPRVLISLTGIGASLLDVKFFNKTDENGNLIHYGLSPGQYYVLPLMKEYQFEPASLLIEIDQERGADDQNLLFRAVKSAFSCRGIVTSINGQSLMTLSLRLPESLLESLNYVEESGLPSSMHQPTSLNKSNLSRAYVEDTTFLGLELYVVATGIKAISSSDKPGSIRSGNFLKVPKKCNLLKEEGKISKASGHFEVNALMPGCIYNLSLATTPTQSISDSASFKDGDAKFRKFQQVQSKLTSILLKSYPNQFIISVPEDQKEDLPEFYRFKLMTPVLSQGGVSGASNSRETLDVREKQFLNLPISSTPSLLHAYAQIEGMVSAYKTISDYMFFQNHSTSLDRNLKPPQSDAKILDFLRISLYQILPNGVDKVFLQSKQLDSRSFFYSFDPILLDLQDYKVVLESLINIDTNVYGSATIYVEKNFNLDSGLKFIPFDFIVAQPKLNLEDGVELQKRYASEMAQLKRRAQYSQYGGDAFYDDYKENRGGMLFDSKVPSPLNLSGSAGYKSNVFVELLLVIVFLSSLIIMVYGPDRILYFIKTGLPPVIEYVLNKSASSFKFSPALFNNHRSTFSSNNRNGSTTTTFGEGNTFLNNLMRGGADISSFLGFGSSIFNSGSTRRYSKYYNNGNDDSDFSNGASATSSHATNTKRSKNKSKKL